MRRRQPHPIERIRLPRGLCNTYGLRPTGSAPEVHRGHTVVFDGRTATFAGIAPHGAVVVQSAVSPCPDIAALDDAWRDWWEAHPTARDERPADPAGWLELGVTGRVRPLHAGERYDLSFEADAKPHAAWFAGLAPDLRPRWAWSREQYPTVRDRVVAAWNDAWAAAPEATVPPPWAAPPRPTRHPAGDRGRTGRFRFPR